jgi:Xaa-Pro aminopeptidase
MIRLPETNDPAPYVARRRRLAELLGGRPALVASGLPRPRNYRANTYPYRASSHFIYLTGASFPAAFLLLDGEEATIFAEPAAPDHALWHGPTPDDDAIEAATGCPVRPLAELPEAVGARALATLPPPDQATAEVLMAYVGHPLGIDPPFPTDEALFDGIIALRLVHDEAAQAELRRAAAATAAAHRAGMRATIAGAREWVVRAAMEAEIVGRGMTHAYNPIVTVHGEVLHNDAHHHRLEEGDLLLADVGAETCEGWAADVTRTWPVTGTFSTTQREIYEVVLRAQQAAIEKVRPGARYRDVHLAACHALAEGLVALGILRGDVAELVEDDVHALFFPHGIGHLLGLDVHDMEDLGDRAGYAPGRTRSDRFGLRYLRLDRDLVPGMAVTIEPGFYQVPALLEDPDRLRAAGDRLDRARLAQFADVRGIRIEDDVLVRADGAEVLTAAIPKAPDDVETAVGMR